MRKFEILEWRFEDFPINRVFLFLLCGMLVLCLVYFVFCSVTEGRRFIVFYCILIGLCSPPSPGYNI